MSKASRRKKARERTKALARQAKEQANTEYGPLAAVAATVAEPPAVQPPGGAAYAGGRVEETPAGVEATVDGASSYITEPIAPRSAPRTARVESRVEAGARLDLPSNVEAPIESEDDENDLLDGDDEDDEDDDGPDGDDEDDEDGPEDEEEVLFNLACTAVEQGDKLTWKEVIAWTLAYEVDDPRLGLLCYLLAEGDTTMSGERVLGALEAIELDDIVAEARETTELGAGDGEGPEERALIRTTSKELAKQSRREIPSEHRPRKASDVRKQQQGGRRS